MQIADPPYRWDLVTPDQLGALPAARFPYEERLVIAAAKVLARSGGGPMYFVGRSPDSMFDLLSGALEGTSAAPRLHRLAYSSSGLSASQRRAAREVLTRQGLTPYALARSRPPVALVDLVSSGRTFTDLFHLLRDWTDDVREPWSVIRRKLRFVGLTWRQETSPKAHRWTANHDWPATLPARSVVNVAIDGWLWHYLGDVQPKLTPSFPVDLWFAETLGPRRGEPVRTALAEAAGLVALGRDKRTKALLVRTMTSEPGYAEGWLRSLVASLGR